MNVLSTKVPWFGKYSGYECLTDYLPSESINKIFYSNNKSFVKKIFGKLIQFKTGIRDTASWELSTNRSFLDSIKNHPGHSLYVEPILNLLPFTNSNQLNHLIGTIHFPLSQWTDERLMKLKYLKHPIIMYEEESLKFHDYLGHDKLKFIRHGVNNDFFNPGNQTRDKNKILFIGHYLRNLEMFERVLIKLSKINPDATFHLVLPKIFRSSPVFHRLASFKQVFFCQNLSDNELLYLYQSSGFMLMPMNDSGANTAIVQAIACGLPIVTTDVGGIRSYGGGKIFPIVPNNDDSAMINLVISYWNNTTRLNDLSVELRKFSLTYLDWEKIAAQHIDYYGQILND